VLLTVLVYSVSSGNSDMVEAVCKVSQLCLVAVVQKQQTVDALVDALVAVVVLVLLVVTVVLTVVV
jgi:hypothetical protein